MAAILAESSLTDGAVRLLPRRISGTWHPSNGDCARSVWMILPIHRPGLQLASLERVALAD